MAKGLDLELHKTFTTETVKDCNPVHQRYARFEILIMPSSTPIQTILISTQILLITRKTVGNHDFTGFSRFHIAIYSH
jgi:hypothetical protein